MEQHPKELNHERSYSAIPRDGPAVYVIEADTGRGKWLRARQPWQVQHLILTEAGIDPDRVVIVDQVGLGPVMVDEDASFDAIERLAQEARQ